MKLLIEILIEDIELLVTEEVEFKNQDNIFHKKLSPGFELS